VAWRLALPMTLNNFAGGIAGGLSGASPAALGIGALLASFGLIWAGQVLGSMMAATRHTDTFAQRGAGPIGTIASSTKAAAATRPVHIGRGAGGAGGAGVGAVATGGRGWARWLDERVVAAALFLLLALNAWGDVGGSIAEIAASRPRPTGDVATPAR